MSSPPCVSAYTMPAHHSPVRLLSHTPAAAPTATSCMPETSSSHARGRACSKHTLPAPSSRHGARCCMQAV